MFNNQKKLSEDFNFFNNIFNTNNENDNDDELYKKQLFTLKEDIDENLDQNSLKYKHDNLLKKLMLEDFSEFPKKSANGNPHSQNNQASSIGQDGKDDDVEKQKEQENEFLREFQKINYLTFSPFALNFFNNHNKKNNSNDMNNSSDSNEDNPSSYYRQSPKDSNKERMLKMINFSYDSYDVNNDLLFNICQGFIDINKLQEKNICEESSKTSNPGTTEIKEVIKEPEPKVVEEDDPEIIVEDVKYVNNFIQNCIKYNVYPNFTSRFMADLGTLSENATNKEKNNFFFEWKMKVKEIEEDLQDEKLKEESEREEKELDKKSRMKSNNKVNKANSRNKKDKKNFSRQKTKNYQRSKSKKSNTSGNKNTSSSKQKHSSVDNKNNKKIKPINKNSSNNISKSKSKSKNKNINTKHKKTSSCVANSNTLSGGTPFGTSSNETKGDKSKRSKVSDIKTPKKKKIIKK